MSVLYESMTKLQWGAWTIRVWAEVPDPAMARDMEIHTALRTIDPVAGGYVDILQTLLELESVSAVEVLDSSGNGTVVYRDWP